MYGRPGLGPGLGFHRDVLADLAHAAFAFATYDEDRRSGHVQRPGQPRGKRRDGT